MHTYFLKLVKHSPYSNRAAVRDQKLYWPTECNSTYFLTFVRWDLLSATWYTKGFNPSLWISYLCKETGSEKNTSSLSFLEENIVRNLSVINTDFFTTYMEIIFPQKQTSCFKKQNILNVLSGAVTDFTTARVTYSFLGGDQKTVILFFVSNKLVWSRKIWELRVLQCPFLLHSRLVFPSPPLLQLVRKNGQQAGIKRGMGICQSGMANLLRQVLSVLTKPNLTAWINKITTRLKRRGKTRAGSIDLRKAVNDRRRDIYLCRWLWPCVN